jgi:hypothetical protein
MHKTKLATLQSTELSPTGTLRYDLLNALQGLPDSRACSQVVKYLISIGANLNLTDEDGDTPLHACEEAAVAAILLDAGANIDARNKEGKTALELHHEEHREGMVSFLATRCAAKAGDLPAGTEFNISYAEESAGAGSASAAPSQPFQFGAPAAQGAVFNFGASAPAEQKNAGKKQRQ